MVPGRRLHYPLRRRDTTGAGRGPGRRAHCRPSHVSGGRAPVRQGAVHWYVVSTFHILMHSPPHYRTSPPQAPFPFANQASPPLTRSVHRPSPPALHLSTHPRRPCASLRHSLQAERRSRVCPHALLHRRPRIARACRPRRSVPVPVSAVSVPFLVQAAGPLPRSLRPVCPTAARSRLQMASALASAAMQEVMLPV